jgi:hypothetical protein
MVFFPDRFLINSGLILTNYALLLHQELIHVNNTPFLKDIAYAKHAYLPINWASST